MSDNLWSPGLQHTRLACPSLTPIVYSNSCPSSQWCPPTISSSVLPSIFSSIRVFSNELVLLQSIGVSTLYVCSVQRQKGMPLDRTNFSIVNSNKLKYKVWVLSYFIRVRLFATRLLCPWGFSKQEYWTGLLCPSPGDLPDPGIKPVSLTSLALAGEFFSIRAT